MGENDMLASCGGWCQDATKSIRRKKQCLTYNTTGLIADECSECGETPDIMHDNEDWWVQCDWCGSCNYLTEMIEFEFPRNEVAMAWNKANIDTEEYVSQAVSSSMYVGEGETEVDVNLPIEKCSRCGYRPDVFYRSGYWVACPNCDYQIPDEANEDSVFPAAKYAINVWNKEQLLGSSNGIRTDNGS